MSEATTLRDLQSFYSLQDAYDLQEMQTVVNYNRLRAQQQE